MNDDNRRDESNGTKSTVPSPHTVTHKSTKNTFPTKFFKSFNGNPFLWTNDDDWPFQPFPNTVIHRLSILYIKISNFSDLYDFFSVNKAIFSESIYV